MGDMLFYRVVFDEVIFEQRSVGQKWADVWWGVGGKLPEAQREHLGRNVSGLLENRWGGWCGWSRVSKAESGRKWAQRDKGDKTCKALLHTAKACTSSPREWEVFPEQKAEQAMWSNWHFKRLPLAEPTLPPQHPLPLSCIIMESPSC